MRGPPEKGNHMPSKSDANLSRRERQIMDILYARGRASVAEVHQAISDRPSYSSIRALMRILEEKGHLKHTAEGAKYIYSPVRSREDAGRVAAKRLMRTFFAGSAELAVAALLEAADGGLSKDQLTRLSALIDKAKKEGR